MSITNTKHTNKMPRPPLDLTGERFGRLVARKRLPSGTWWCECECGSWTEVTVSNLRSGNTRSCGCLLRDTAKATGESLRGTARVPAAASGLRRWREQDPRSQGAVIAALRNLSRSRGDAYAAAALLLYQAAATKKKT